MAEGRIERRLAAILAADVAGYSRLIGVDEEGTLAALQGLAARTDRSRIAEHRGRVVKTAGDGMLVEFASVLDALRAADAVQREMAERNADVAAGRRIEFRIGIHQGDIVVEDGDIFGDGVNVAARLEGSPSPGNLRLGAGAGGRRRRLDLDFEDMGEQALKNIARPVRVYRLLARGPHPDPPSLAGEAAQRGRAGWGYAALPRSRRPTSRRLRCCRS